MIKLNNTDINGTVLEDSSRFLLTTNQTLKNLQLYQTVLHPSQFSNGHCHLEHEEVYFFVAGQGSMQVGSEHFVVNGGDIVLIPDGLYHKVWNTGNCDLIFNTVFEIKRKYYEPQTEI